MEHSRVHEQFVEALRQRALMVVDPRQRFERNGNPLGYYFKIDGHWNAEGHRIAAEELAAALARQSNTNAVDG